MPPTTSWYYIYVYNQPFYGGGEIMSAYFNVDDSTNAVLGFYQKNNTTEQADFTNNILNGSGEYGSNNIYYNPQFDPPNTFSEEGTLINVSDIFVGGNSISKIQFVAHKDLSDNTTYEYADCWLTNGNGNIGANYTVTPISDPSCFNEGTKILCLNKNLQEEYIPIENLRKGDLVKSYKHGYRKIDLIGKNIMINDPTGLYKCMYKMEKTETNGLIEDLIITGGHSILVDKLKDLEEEILKGFGFVQTIDDKQLLLACVSKDFVKLEDNTLYTYYHFILENNGNDNERFGVWANGILTETSSKNEFVKHNYTFL
jgi:hypothetical protein